MKNLMAYRYRRVFKEEVGKWPKVYANNRCLRIRGGYFGPKGKYYAKCASQLMFAAVWLWTFATGLSINPAADGAEMIGGLLAMAGVAAMVATPPALVTWGTALLLLRQHLDIRLFRDGSIKTEGGRVRKNVARSFVVVPHERSFKEAREDQKLREKGEKARTDYRDASQVFILSGMGGMHRTAVAAFGDDPMLHQGHMLRSVMEYMDALVQAVPEEERVVPHSLPVQAVVSAAYGLWAMIGRPFARAPRQIVIVQERDRDQDSDLARIRVRRDDQRRR